MITYKISKLHLENFRNLENKLITFSPSINCIFGENGNGKTNILEAIYFLSTKKSFRKKASFPQMLSIDCEKPEILIRALINTHDLKEFSYTAKITNQNLEWSINGELSKKRIDLKVVFINPFDSYDFHTSSSTRRDLFDYLLSQYEKDYRKLLNKYNTALRFKNVLISGKPNKYIEQIRIIDKELAVLNLKITDYRENFLKELNPLLSQCFRELFSEQHELKVDLETKFSKLSPELAEKLLTLHHSSDLERGHTQIGIHRDDFVLQFDGLNSFEYCSLGQQKMSYLSLLFAYIELFRYKYMSFPMVLIDDVSGELDQHRWKRLVEYLKKREFQVFITTANEKFKEELEQISGANKINVKSGSITQ